MLMILLLLEYQFHSKRSKPINLKMNGFQNIISIKFLDKQINLIDIKNMDIVKFIHSRSFSYTLIVNHTMYLIYPKEAITKRLSKEAASIYRDDITTIKQISKENNLDSKTKLAYVPKAINIGFYFIVIVALSLGVFLFTAILTGNTQWFDYFKF